jgi:ATP-dependent DNA ligase
MMDYQGIPAALHPPVSLALAKAVERIPEAGALPGVLLYEPKWDGFRAVILVGADGVSLFSRQGKDLTRISLSSLRRPLRPSHLDV